MEAGDLTLETDLLEPTLDRVAASLEGEVEEEVMKRLREAGTSCPNSVSRDARNGANDSW